MFEACEKSVISFPVSPQDDIVDRIDDFFGALEQVGEVFSQPKRLEYLIMLRYLSRSSDVVESVGLTQGRHHPFDLFTGSQVRVNGDTVQ